MLITSQELCMPPMAYARYLEAARTAAVSLLTELAGDGAEASAAKASPDSVLWALTLVALAERYIPGRADATAHVALARRVLAPHLDWENGILHTTERATERTAAVVRLGAIDRAPALLALADTAAEDLLRRLAMGGTAREDVAEMGEVLLRLALAVLPSATQDTAHAHRLAQLWHGAAQATDRLCEAPHSSAAVAQIARLARIKGAERPLYTAIAEEAFPRWADGVYGVYAAHSLYLLTGKECYLILAAEGMARALSSFSFSERQTDPHALRIVCCLAETLLSTAFVLLRADGTSVTLGCQAVRFAEGLSVTYTAPVHHLHLTLSAPCLLLMPHHQISLSPGKHTLCAVTGRRSILPL